MSSATPMNSGSEHFELFQVAEGAYAAVATPEGAAFSNAGIIDLGDRTLVFDAFETPAAAADLRRAAERLCGRGVSQVIISHAHPDHYLGCQAFPEAVLLTTHANYAEIQQEVDEIKAMQAAPAELEEALHQTEERLAAETDSIQRTALMVSIARQRHRIAALPTLEVKLPHLTFEGRLVFSGPRRKAELVALGKGHTASDCYLLLADEKVAFIGDLGFFQCQPFMVYSDPTAWAEHLLAFEAMDLEVFVPGHGPMGTKADLALLRRYMTVLHDFVASVIASGGTVDEALAGRLPAPFDGWQAAERNRFEANVRAAFKRLKENG